MRGDVGETLEATVVHLLLAASGIQFNDSHVGGVVEIGRGIIERNVTILSNTNECHINGMS